MTPEPHSSPIKTPKQLIIVVVLAFAVPIAIIALLSQLATSGSEGGDANTDESHVLARIQPVGSVVLAEAGPPKGSMTGQQVFDQVCKTCHGAGIAGAPKVGDKAAWGPRIAEGEKTLFQHAIGGFQGKSGVMPPKGGNAELADVEVERAVVLMANQSGGQLKEPPAPAPVPATAGTTPPAGSVGVATASAGASLATATPPSSSAPGAPAPSSGANAPAAPAATTPPASAPAAGAAPAAPAKVAAAGNAAEGKKVYEQTCHVCHGPGLVGAPKFGDKAAWAPRLAEGVDTLHQHAIHGYQGKTGVMPPKGGNSALSDADVMAAVDYMAGAAK